MCVSPRWQVSKWIIFYKIFYLFSLFEGNPCICACVCVYMCVKYIYNFIKKIIYRKMCVWRTWRGVF